MPMSAQTLHTVQLSTGAIFSFPAKVWADEIVMRRLFALEGIELPPTSDDESEGDWLDLVFLILDGTEEEEA